MKNTFLLIFLLTFLNVQNSNAAWLVKKSGERIRVMHVERTLDQPQKVIKSIPAVIEEGPVAPRSEKYEEILFQDDALPLQYQKYIVEKDAAWAGSEVRTLVKQGPPENRIDLTIVGDGYTEQEKEKFFNDAKRITDELFGSNTFASYLPLFNVYAVFVPSNESGLTDVTRVDTALGLYRSPAGSKRAIMPGNYSAIDRAVSLAPDADYPILIANDDYYGGLGGQYAITTRSEKSGIIVLRHELGHNFGEVGEEYDNGSVYSGANSSDSSDVTWKAWLSNKNASEVYEVKQISGDYVWQNLRGNPYHRQFQFPKGDYHLNISVSSVGWDTKNSVQVLLDNQPLDLLGEFTKDRSFFEINTTSTAGTHLLDAKELVTTGQHVLAYIRAYAVPNNTNKENHHVAAYATFDVGGGKTYRPTYDTCLMRNMLSEEFCTVDQENFWYQFLNRVSLVDEVKTTKSQNGYSVEIITAPLKGLTYTWYKLDSNGAKELPNKTNTLKVSTNEVGNYRVEVEFKTPEVRQYNFSVKKDIRVQ